MGTQFLGSLHTQKKKKLKKKTSYKQNLQNLLAKHLQKVARAGVRKNVKGCEPRLRTAGQGEQEESSQ